MTEKGPKKGQPFAIRRSAPIAAATAAIFATMGQVAQAAESADPVDQVAQQVAEVAPAADVTDATATSTGYVATLDGGASITVPSGGDGAVIVDDAVAISLPDEASGIVAAQADDGTIVYDSGAAVDVAVQTLEEGVRIATILADATAPTEYRYEMPGLSLMLQADGSVIVQAGGATADDGTLSIAPAWAFDATGTAVPTYYSVEGSTLVQTVEHDRGTYAYPVVADPTWSVGLGVYVWFNKAETKAISGMGWSGAAFTTLCAALGSAGGIYGAAAMGAACLVEAVSIIYTAAVAVEKTNQTPKTPTCLRLRWWLGSTNPATYRGGNCK